MRAGPESLDRSSEGLHSVAEAAFDLGELGIDGGVELAALGMEVEIAGGEGGIADDLDVGRDAEAFEARADGGGVRGMKDDAGEFAGVDTLQGGFGDAGDGFGVGGEFAVEDAAGDGQGESDEVGFGLSAKGVAFEGLVGDGAGELLIDGTLLGLERFADAAVAFAESFIAGLRGLGAQGEFEFGNFALELFELGGIASGRGGGGAGRAGAERLGIGDDGTGVGVLAEADPVHRLDARGIIGQGDST